MIEHGAVFWTWQNLLATNTDAPEWRYIVHSPGSLVETVDVLLDDVIAGEPRKVLPVAYLKFQVAPLLLARKVLQRRGEVACLQGKNVPDGSVVDTCQSFALAKS